jgi:CDP-6-deoxy-D-xylo-4-hexulose-3-dehydrase
MKFRNLEFDSFKDLQDIIRKNISKQIVPGNDYIPVTGKVLDEEDILIRR